MLRTALLTLPLALCFGCGDEDASSDSAQPRESGAVATAPAATAGA